MDRMQQTEGAGGVSPPALSDAIEKIMANPELISMVASALGKGDAPGGASAAETEQVPKEKAREAGDLPALMGALGPLLSGQSGGAKSNSACLLRALKPYVSRGRGEAIDTMIRISEFSEILKRMR